MDLSPDLFDLFTYAHFFHFYAVHIFFLKSPLKINSCRKFADFVERTRKNAKYVGMLESIDEEH